MPAIWRNESLRPGSRVRLSLIGAVAVLLCGASGCRGDRSAPAAADVPRGEALVRVTPLRIARKSLVRFCEQPGHVAAYAETPLAARLQGYVARVHVDIGDRVRGPRADAAGQATPGQLLIEIDVPELQREMEQKEAAVEQAEAEVRQSEATVDVAKAALESARALLEESEAGEDRAEADVRRWQSEEARIAELAERQAVTAKLLDETRSQLAAALAARKECAARIRSSQARLGEAEFLVAKAAADLTTYMARHKSAIADRNRTAARLAFRELRAPFDGIIATRRVEMGQLVEAGPAEPLLVLVNTDTVRVAVDVPEVDAVQLQPGTRVTIRAPSLPGDGIAAETTRTSWVLNQATRTLRVECDLANPEGRLRPGMYVLARIQVAERPAALAVPKAALFTASGQSACWKIDATGMLVLQSVRTGLESAGEVEIIEGLAEGDEIVGVNPAAFRAGQRVDRLPAKSP